MLVSVKEVVVMTMIVYQHTGYFRAHFVILFFRLQIGRPKPKEGEQIEAVLKRDANEDILDIVSLQEEVANIDGKYEEDDKNELEAKRKVNRDASYENRIKEAIKTLKTNAGKYLNPEWLKNL